MGSLWIRKFSIKEKKVIIKEHFKAVKEKHETKIYIKHAQLIRSTRTGLQGWTNTFISVKSNTWKIAGATSNLGSKASTTGCMHSTTDPIKQWKKKSYVSIIL